MSRVTIRQFQDSDAAETASIFFDSIQLGTARYYDETQRSGWAPAIPETAQWLKKLSAQTVLVAEHKNRPVGFMSLTTDGCIDLAYVRPEVMGTGVAQQLYEALLIEAISQDFSRLHTHASYLARSFFLKNGWSLLAQQVISRGDIKLVNFRMEKFL